MFDIVYTGDLLHAGDWLDPAPRLRVLRDDELFCAVDILLAGECMGALQPIAAGLGMRTDDDCWVRGPLVRFAADGIQRALRRGALCESAGKVVVLTVSDQPTRADALYFHGVEFATFLRGHPQDVGVRPGEVLRRFTQPA